MGSRKPAVGARSVRGTHTGIPIGHLLRELADQEDDTSHVALISGRRVGQERVLTKRPSIDIVVRAFKLAAWRS